MLCYSSHNQSKKCYASSSARQWTMEYPLIIGGTPDTYSYNKTRTTPENEKGLKRSTWMRIYDTNERLGTRDGESPDESTAVTLRSEREE